MTSTILEPVIGTRAAAALLRRLYRTMATVRRLDREAVVLRGRGVLPEHIDSRGREAVHVGDELRAAVGTARAAALPVVFLSSSGRSGSASMPVLLVAEIAEIADTADALADRMRVRLTAGV